MQMNTKILDQYFLDQIKKRGHKASKLEVTQFFEEMGWKMYDFDSMLQYFSNWKRKK